MNTTIKTALAAILLLAVSCRKENTLQSSRVADESTTGLLSDINDPDVQAYVRIGTQKWMAKNLAVTRYRNGDRIPQVKLRAQWDTLTTGAWCWYNNDSATGAVYGKLYNWYAVHDPRDLAPIGWHVPNYAEWDTLATYLGANAGGKLKDTGTIEAGNGLWYAPNTGATNKTGFTALPGGYRAANGVFHVHVVGFYGYLWSSTEGDGLNARFRWLSCNNSNLNKDHALKRDGFSVRCIKD
jgi:uncharacterized protein (TIGR02145 family)